MSQPRQLAKARRPRRSAPRGLVETTRRLDIADLSRLKVLPAWNDRRRYWFESPFDPRFTFCRGMHISRDALEIIHFSGYKQRVRLRWAKTGFGGHWHQQPYLICECGKPSRRLYIKRGHLACRKCFDLVYASQTQSKRGRKALQQARLAHYLGHKRYLRKTTRSALQARLRSLGRTVELWSQRINHKAQLPITNYQASPLV